MEETKNGLSRRNFLVNGSTAVGAVGLAALSAGSLLVPRDAHAAMGPFYQPASLDVDRVRYLAFYWYKKGPGCGHGSARGLIQAFAEASEAAGQGTETAWHQIPRNLYAWSNGGGPAAWGTICGSIAGTVGVMNLIGRQGDIGQAIFEWYVQQNFPYSLVLPVDFNGGAGTLANTEQPIPHAQVKAQVVSDSPLCHISVSKWLVAAGVQHGEKQTVGSVQIDCRGDRCGKVTADTAAHAALLYNQFKAWEINKIGASPIVAWSKPPAMATCFDCHDPNGTPGVTVKTSATKMDCLPCHTEPKSGRK